MSKRTSNTSTRNAATLAGIRGVPTSGADYARSFINRCRADPGNNPLECCVNDAEHLLFKDNEGELLAFFATLQNAIVKTKPAKLTEENVKQIGSDMYQITSAIFSMLNIARSMNINDDEEAAKVAGIQALCEKAGTLADRCTEALGDVGGIYGPWEAWAGLERAAVEPATEAGEAQHE